MYFNFNFSSVKIHWTFTLGGMLVLLGVMLGRHRARRFPWFTTFIGLMAVRFVSGRLLYRHVSGVVLDEVFLGLVDLAAVAAVLVAVEIARRAFAGAGRREWVAGTLVLLAVAGLATYLWAPWPSMEELFPASGVSALTLMQFFADKTLIFFNALFVQVGLLVVLFGRKFNAGWHTHTQRLAIGLMVAALGQLVVEGTAHHIETLSHTYTPEHYKSAMEIMNSLLVSNSIILLMVLVWCIVNMWIDEPGTKRR